MHIPKVEPWQVHLGIIVFTYLITWIRSVKCGFVSDDHEGIERFSEYMSNGIKQTTYKEFDKDWKFSQFNPKIAFPYSVIRWFRIVYGRSLKVIGKNEKGHEVYGYVQSPFKHHLLNLILNLINSILTYTLFTQLFGAKLAFLSALLFAVNPISSTLVWISSFGYLLSYFGITANNKA